jgi:hypothetical protein
VGVSYKRLLRVPFVFATVFAVVNFGIVGWLQPVTRMPMKICASSFAPARSALRSRWANSPISVAD